MKVFEVFETATCTSMSEMDEASPGSDGCRVRVRVKATQNFRLNLRLFSFRLKGWKLEAGLRSVLV